MRRKFISGIVAGSVIGATAGMYATSKMSPRQRRKMMKTSKRMLAGVVNNMHLL